MEEYIYRVGGKEILVEAETLTEADEKFYDLTGLNPLNGKSGVAVTPLNAPINNKQ